jgi:hypothetical protein
MTAGSYEEVRMLQGAAESVRRMWLANKEVHNQYDYTYLTGEWRIGRELELGGAL